MVLSVFARTASKVVAPIGGAAIANQADARVVKYYNSSYAPELKRAEQTGEDLANTAYGRFVVQFVATIPDRFSALANEIVALPAHAAVWRWSGADYLLFIQFFIRFFFLYLVGKMIGRESLHSHILPSSLFFDADEKIEVDATRAYVIKSLTAWAAPLNPLI